MRTKVVHSYYAASVPIPPADPDRLELATDQAIEACGEIAREAVKALIVTNCFLERRLEALASPGYAGECCRLIGRIGTIDGQIALRRKVVLVNAAR